MKINKGEQGFIHHKVLSISVSMSVYAVHITLKVQLSHVSPEEIKMTAVSGWISDGQEITERTGP